MSDGTLTLAERVAVAATPAANRWTAWFESDGLHMIDDAGNEMILDIAAGKKLNVDNSLILNGTDGNNVIPAKNCAFLAFNSADDDNETGDGTNVTVEFDTEVYDVGGDYDNATDTFTAPETGYYLLMSTVNVKGLDATHTQGFVQIVTSNRSYTAFYINIGAVRDSSDSVQLQAFAIADMDATDTATINVRVSGGGKTADIYGHATAMHTRFMGAQLA